MNSRHENASDGVPTDLCELQDQHEENAVQLCSLRAAIKAGFDRGPGEAAQEVFDRLELKYRDMARNRRA